MSDRLIVLHEADRDSKVSLAEGDTFEVRLPENAGTGFVWTVRAAPEGLELVGDGSQLPDALRAGGAAERWFRFVARRAVSGPVELELRRPWEYERFPAATFAAEIEPAGE